MRLSILLLMVSISNVWSHHILCVFPVPARSHHALGKAVVEVLIEAGHQVTWITPYPNEIKPEAKNIDYIDISEVKELAKKYDLLDPKNAKMRNTIDFVKEFGHNIITKVLSMPLVVEAITKTQYDAVITEKFFTELDAGIAAIQQAPWLVLVSTAQMSPMLEAWVDEVRSVTTVPLMFNNCPIPMGFMDRVINTMIYSFMALDVWQDRQVSTPLYNSIYKPLASARGVPLPSLSDAVHNVSILFINTHESLAPAFSTPPNVVSVGGYHIPKKVAPLPKDLQEILDNSPQGVVYFSMGSILRSSELPQKTREQLLKFFGTLKQTVLWKFEEELGELPKNVHVRSWFPQLSVLAHPNIKAFITHGGQQSSGEAVSFGVPILALPVFGDQPANTAIAVRAGYAVRGTFGDNIAGEIEEKLITLLNNDSYIERARYLSKVYHARPVHPADLIRHYTELAIETKGAYHLRSLSLQYAWYERWMLDVVLVALALLVTALATLLLALRFCFRLCFGKKSSIETKKNK